MCFVQIGQPLLAFPFVPDPLPWAKYLFSECGFWAAPFICGRGSTKQEFLHLWTSPRIDTNGFWAPRQRMHPLSFSLCHSFSLDPMAFSLWRVSSLGYGSYCRSLCCLCHLNTLSLCLQSFFSCHLCRL